MKKHIFIILIAISFSCYGQRDLENGMRGSVARGIINENFDTLYNFNESYINPRNFGAVGDGVTDDWQAFQTALDSAASQGKEFIIPAGIYRIDSEIDVSTFDRDHPCIIRGQGYVKLDYSNMMVAQSGFELHSDYDDDLTDLDYDLEKGDTILISALASGLQRGDILEILSDSLWGRTFGIYKREMVKVRRTSNDSIFLYTPIYDSYDAVGTGVRNLNAAILRIENIELIGNIAVFQNAFTLSSFRDICIRNVITQDFFNIGFAITRCIGGAILDCTATEQQRDGFGYGVSLQVCQNLVVSGCKIYGARHAIEMGLTTRSIVIEKNYVYAAPAYNYPMDCHESCEYLTWRDNFLYGGGFYLRGLNYSVDNNRIFITKAGGAAIGIVLYGYEPRVNEHIDIINNKVYKLHEGAAQHYAIQVKYWHQNDTIRNLNISNNQFDVGSHGVFFNTEDNNLPGNYIDQIIFNNNIIRNENPNTAAVYLSDSIQYNRIIFSGGSYISEGSGIAVGGRHGSGSIYMNGVFVDANTYPVSTNNSKVSNLYIKNSHFIGTEYLWIDIDNYFLLQNNILENMTKSGLYVERATTFTNDGNLYINNSGSIDDNAGVTNTGVNW